MDLAHHILEYVNCCVGAFANRFNLPMASAYAYLRRFKAIDFLIDCYSAEHTLSVGYSAVVSKAWRTIGMMKLYHGSPLS